MRLLGGSLFFIVFLWQSAQAQCVDSIRVSDAPCSYIGGEIEVYGLSGTYVLSGTELISNQSIGPLSSTILTDLNGGVYSLNIQRISPSSCSFDTILILDQPDALQIISFVSNVSGPGNQDGAVDVTVLGGTEPYLYDWGPEGTNEDISNLSTGQYTLSVTDSNDCILSESFDVNQEVSPFFSIAPFSGCQPNISILDETSGDLDNILLKFSIQGAILDTFFYTNGLNNTYNLSFEYGGLHTIQLSAFDTLLGANQSVYEEEIYIEGPLGSFIIGDNTLCSGDAIYFDLGETANDVIWDFGDGEMDSTNTSALSHVFQSANNLDSFLVNVQFSSDACSGNYEIEAWVFTDNAYNPSPELILSPSEICSGERVNLSVASANASYYVWDFGNGTFDTTITPFTENVFDDNVDSIKVQVNVFNSCASSSFDVEYLHYNDSLPIDPNEDFGLSLSADSICPGDPLVMRMNKDQYEVEWFVDGTSYADNPAYHDFDQAGVYTVLANVSNLCGSSVQNQFVGLVHVSNTLSVDSTAFSNWIVPAKACPGDPILFMSSAGAESYFWSFDDGSSELLSTNGEDLARTLHAYNATGLYSPEITITNGCGRFYTEVLQVEIVNASGFSNPPADFDHKAFLWFEAGEDFFGMAEACEPVKFISLVGGQSFDWVIAGDTIHSEDSITTLYFENAGTVNVEMIASNGCGESISYNHDIEVFGSCNLLSVDTLVMHLNCAGTASGRIVLTPNGGINDYTYNWSHDAELDERIANGLSAGPYSVTVSDAGNPPRVNVLQIELREPDPIEIDFDIESTWCDVSVGSAEATVSGGMQPYSYLWSTGSTDQEVSDVFAGLYALSVTDDNGCETFDVALIEDENGPDIVSQGINDVSCPGAEDGAINIAVGTGQPPFTYFWSTGDSLQDVMGLAGGDYFVKVIDANGCTGFESFEIDEPEAIHIEAMITNPTCGLADGQLEVDVQGGYGNYSYNWSVAGTTNILTNLGSGIYTLTVEDVEGCEDSTRFYLESDIDFELSVLQIIKPICNGQNGEIEVSATGPYDPFTFSLYLDGNLVESQSNAASHRFTGLAPGNYYVKVTSNAVPGCDNKLIIDLPSSRPKAPSTCLITVNDEGYNNLIWNRSNDIANIDHFNIYRESVESNVFDLADEVLGSVFSSYEDLNADPRQKSHRYRISAVDLCGIESQQALAHKTIHARAVLDGSDVNINWNHYEGFNYTDINIWRKDSDTSDWTIINSLSTGNTINSYRDQNIPSSIIETALYRVEALKPDSCFATKTVIHNGNSGRSNSSGVTAPIAYHAYALSNGVSGSGQCDAEGHAIVIGGLAPYTYQWDDASNQTTETAYGLCEGFYTCVITDASSQNTSCTLFVASPTNLYELGAQPLEIRHMNNQIEVKGLNKSPYQVTIVNASGQLVCQKRAIQSKFDLPKLAKGLYNIRIVQNEQRASINIILH